jgi:hypothetical protein
MRSLQFGHFAGMVTALLAGVGGGHGLHFGDMVAAQAGS